MSQHLVRLDQRKPVFLKHLLDFLSFIHAASCMCVVSVAYECRAHSTGQHELCISSAWAVPLSIIITAESFLITFTIHLFSTVEILLTVRILCFGVPDSHRRLPSGSLAYSSLHPSPCLALPRHVFASLVIPVITPICVRTFALTSLKKQLVRKAWLGKDGWR